MADEIAKENEYLSTIAALEKENSELKAKEAEKERNIILEQLVSKTGKDAKEFEGKSVEVLKELLTFMPEKKVEERKVSKGVAESVAVPPQIEEKETIQIVENGDLTMTDAYWKEYDNSIRDLSWVNGVSWHPNKVGTATKK